MPKKFHFFDIFNIYRMYNTLFAALLWDNDTRINMLSKGTCYHVHFLSKSDDYLRREFLFFCKEYKGTDSESKTRSEWMVELFTAIWLLNYHMCITIYYYNSACNSKTDADVLWIVNLNTYRNNVTRRGNLVHYIIIAHRWSKTLKTYTNVCTQLRADKIWFLLSKSLCQTLRQILSVFFLVYVAM